MDSASIPLKTGKAFLEMFIEDLSNSENFKLPPRRFDYERGRNFGDPETIIVGSSFRYPGADLDVLTFETHLTSALLRVATFPPATAIPEQATTILTVPILGAFKASEKWTEPVAQFIIHWINDNPRVTIPSLQKD